jgi:phosphate transport system substrate-binding protein
MCDIYQIKEIVMKNTLRTVVASFALVALAGCAAKPAPLAPSGASAAMSAHADVVTLPGSGDSQDVLRALAKGYNALYPARQVVVPDSIDSSGGVRVVGTGEWPIGRVSRLPNTEEKAKYGDFYYLEFARVPVAFVVDPKAGVHNLSEQQMCDIFRGRITNWKAVGGKNLPIAVQSRPLSGASWQTIRKNIACFAQLELTSKAHFNERNADLVTSMRSTAGAIGFMPLSEATTYGYHVVTLNGVAPIQAQYKLGIGLGFVYQKSLPSSVQAFLDYLKTASAHDIMRKTGHVPVEG